MYYINERGDLTVIAYGQSNGESGPVTLVSKHVRGIPTSPGTRTTTATIALNINGAEHEIASDCRVRDGAYYSLTP